MEQINNKFLTDLTTNSNSKELCEIHNIYKTNQINSPSLCHKCWKEEQDKELSKEVTNHFVKDRNYGYLKKASILDDMTIYESRILNYSELCEETAMAKRNVLKAISEWKEGDNKSLFLHGNAGVGKSHLSYSILHELNEHFNDNGIEKRCMFVSLEKLFRLVKDSFSNKESIYTEEFVIKTLSNVDFLVLDDLGAETGNIDTQKIATDFTSRILYAVYNGRQGKPTITTTNLDGVRLSKMYDKKMSDRMLNNSRLIGFKTAKSQRKTLPF